MKQIGQRTPPAGHRNGKPPPPVPCLLVTQPTDDAEPAPDPATSATPGMPGTTGATEPGPSPSPVPPKAIQYKGAPLEAEKGPGLGCFRFQLVVLVILLILTPIGVNAGWPDWLTAALLFITLALLLVAGQTVIFLLRLVAADRRGRRRPLASQTRTVGELDDATDQADGDGERSVRQ
jgi:hypothetical protein